METLEARILLRNLIERIVESDEGRRSLPGTVTSDEISALRMALDALRDPSSDTPTPETPQLPASESASIQADESAQIQLDYAAINAEPPPKGVRFCLDFGTAMSKATLVRENDDGTEEVEVLPLGVPSEQERISEHMLISSIFIDRLGQMWFGQNAIDKSMQEGADGTHQRIDSIKRRLSENGWDEKVNLEHNPTDEEVTYGELVLAYLTFLTWVSNRCLEDLGYSRLLCRRFAMPCFEEQRRRREFVSLLQTAVGEAQVLADSFGDQLKQGLSLRNFVEASRVLRRQEHSYTFVDEEVTEPMGVAGSMARGEAHLDHLVLVVDIGAGTSDLGLYRILVDPERSKYIALEAQGSTRVLTEAGDHLDRLLIQFILAKAGIDRNEPNYAGVIGELNLRIRTYKEDLFNNETVFVAMPRSSNHAGVEIELTEFCNHRSVRQFGERLKSAITGILESVDDSWVEWVRAHPARTLVVALAGGGAEMPMVRELTEHLWEVNGKKLYTTT